MIAFVLETQGLSSPSLLILVTITMIPPIIAESNISKASHKCVVLKSSHLTRCNSGTISSKHTRSEFLMHMVYQKAASHKHITQCVVVVVLESSNLTQCNSGTIYAFISASFSYTWFDCLAKTHYTVCGSIQYRQGKLPHTITQAYAL